MGTPVVAASAACYLLACFWSVLIAINMSFSVAFVAVRIREEYPLAPPFSFFFALLSVWCVRLPCEMAVDECC